MQLTTHIIGTHEATIAELCDQLLAQDIEATHPATDGFFNAGVWSPYEIDLSNYELIAAGNSVVVCNNGPLTTPLAQQICYALAKSKSVILTHELVFAPDTDRQLAHIILRQAQHLHIPESTDHLGNFLHTLPRKQSYALTAREQLRIVIMCRAHFRELLQKSVGHLPLTRKLHAL